MMKRFFVSLAAITAVLFGSASFDASAKTVPAKPKAVAKASVNPLIGKWVVDNQGARVDIEFTADTATFIAYNNASGDEIKYVSSYKFSKSPLKLTLVGRSEEPIPVTMTYKVVGKKLTYRFIKAGQGIEKSIYLKRLPNEKTKVIDIVAIKAEVEEPKAEVEAGGH